MKKSTILAFIMIAMCIMLGTTIANAQEKPTTGDQISQVVETVFDKTSEAVKSLADALKVPAEHVYTVLVKQQVAKSVINLSVLILLLISCSISLYLYNKYYKAHIQWNKDNQRSKDVYDTTPGSFAITYGIIGVVIFIISILHLIFGLSTIITGFINPEYGAIKEIMSLL